MRRCLFIWVMLLLVLVSWAPAPAHAYPSDITWRTIETEHFRINYQAELKPMALFLARMAEQVHAELSDFLEYQNTMKTELLLVDHVDTPNGFVNVYPYNHMVLYAVPPDRGSVLNDYDDWFRMLFVHEHTHVIQLDTKSDLPAIINKIFGGLVHPNQYMPRWYTEGMAVYNESYFTAGGRGRSSLFEMYLRADVAEGRVVTLDQINGGNTRWPYGHIPYLYGGRFMQYLAEKYDNKTYAALGYLYGQRIMPLALSTVLRKVTDDDFVRLYDEWVAQLHARYREDIKRLEALGLTPLTYVTHKGEEHGSPVLFPNGERMLYYHDDARPFRRGWALRDIAGDDYRIILNADNNGGATIAPDGRRIVIGQLAYTDAEYMFHDLYLHDMDRNETTRLTKGLRAREPSFAPDGRRIAYVQYGPGHSQLMILDTDTGEPSAPIPGDSFDQVFSPAWSPDGRHIAFAAWRQNNFKDMWVLDLEQNRLIRISNDRNLDVTPSWSPDGRTLYWSSDRTGIFNIYSCDMQTMAVRQLTNVIGGVVSPMTTGDGARLYVSSYRSHGFDLAYVDMANTLSQPAPDVPELRRRYPVDYPDVPWEERAYSPFPSLYPKLWLPTFGTDHAGRTLGIRTWGDDLAGEHSFTAEFDIGVESGEPTIGLSYSNRSFRPSIGLSGTHTSYTLVDAVQVGAETEDQQESRTSGSLSLSFPFRHRYVAGKTSRLIAQSISVSTYFRYTRLLDRYGFEPTSIPPTYADTGLGTGLSLTWSLQDRESHPTYIGGTSGRSLYVSVRSDTEILGSDVNNIAITAGWGEYIGIPWVEGHSLAFKLSGGFGVSNYRNRNLFYLGGPPDIDLVDDLIRQNRTYGDFLRGYKPLSAAGDKYLLFKSEYRMVLWTIDRGVYTLPIFFKRVHLAPFFDVGHAWTDDFDLSESKRGVGAELRLDVIVGYFTYMTVSMGYQIGLDDGGVSALFFTIDNMF